jgi:hypothetical protein
MDNLLKAHSLGHRNLSERPRDGIAGASAAQNAQGRRLNLIWANFRYFVPVDGQPGAGGRDGAQCPSREPGVQ